jgi:release factor glutamine methyltransferase
MKIGRLLQDAAIKLKNAGIQSYSMEARILLKAILGVSEEFLLLRSQDEVDLVKIEVFEQFVARRVKLEPVAYILGFREFYGREFEVSPDVLVPRPDSEILIEAILSDYKLHEDLQILELGVGSGCLITTLLLELKKAYGVAVDISIDAIEIARKNATRFNVSNIEFIQSDWFDNITQEKNFDIIVANPPYIESDSLEVARETALYEPHLALFAADNGLAAYKEIAVKARSFLSVNGSIYLEIGYDQEVAVTDLFVAEGYLLHQKYIDLAGYIRCLHFKI